MRNYSVELFRDGDIKCLGMYSLARAYRAFATCIRLVESGEYGSVCIFVWDDGLPCDIIAEFNDYDVEL